MSTTIVTAEIPARTERGQTKSFEYPAHQLVFVRDDDGRWSMDGQRILEDDVIDACRKAVNWQQIRSEHFAMDGFSS